MDQLWSVVLVMLMLTVTLSDATRCYWCRDVVLRSGIRKEQLFMAKYNELKQDGWIQPCSDDSFVAIAHASCKKRVYISYEMCFPNRKCTVKVTERYPVLPPQMIREDDPFFKERLSVGMVLKEKPCKSDLCNGDYKNEYKVGLKCYHQCGKITLGGLTEEELANYDLPVVQCDNETTYNYCGLGMECGYIVGSAVYTDDYLGRDITVTGWYADCFYQANNTINHVLDVIRLMMKEHPNLEISPDDLTKCDKDLCNYIE